MLQRNRRTAALLLLVAVLSLGVSACVRGQAAEGGEGASEDAVKLEPVQGTELSLVTLSQRAADSLGIETTQVRLEPAAPKPGAGATGKGGGATTRKTIPAAAVLYDANGDTWTFTSPKPLNFLRQKISIDVVQGNLAVLSDGPPVGTTVVTVGASELLGAELGVGE